MGSRRRGGEDRKREEGLIPRGRGTMNAVEVDLASPEFKADPYPFFARLRETAPACRVTLPGRQTAWLLTRYDDVAAALKDGRFAKDPNNALTPDQAARQPWFPKLFRPLTRN